MQTTNETNEYYTYDEAAEVLGVSYGHLARAIAEFGTFHPVRTGKGARKHLLKSEVDAMVGKQLFTQRKIKEVKRVPFQDVPGARIDVEAIRTEVTKQTVSAVSDTLGKVFSDAFVELITSRLSHKIEGEDSSRTAVPFRFS